jgi:hypothetical protein
MVSERSNKTERHGTAISSRVSYAGGPRPADRLLSLGFFVGFLSSSRKIQVYYLKLGNEHVILKGL